MYNTLVFRKILSASKPTIQSIIDVFIITTTQTPISCP